jgi:hypothetical protein
MKKNLLTLFLIGASLVNTMGQNPAIDLYRTGTNLLATQVFADFCIFKDYV